MQNYAQIENIEKIVRVRIQGVLNYKNKDTSLIVTILMKRFKGTVNVILSDPPCKDRDA